MENLTKEKQDIILNTQKKETVRELIYKYFWFFVIGSFLGSVGELLYWFVYSGKWEHRQSLIHFPFIPIYGLGMVIFDLVFRNIKNKKWYIIFPIGMVTGGTFEFLCSLFQEYFLGSKSWDYSDTFLNINGRVNLFYCVIWGLCSILYVKLISPCANRIVSKLSNKKGKIVAIILFVLLLVDTIISCYAIRRTSNRQNGIVAQNSLESFVDEVYDDDFMKKIYPNMKFYE